MPAVVNDLSGNPWVLAEQGEASPKQVRVGAFIYCAPATSGAVAELEDSHGRIILQLDDSLRQVQWNGWVHGITVRRLDSGYVVVVLDSR
mgnify:CR=1 FL=1